MKLTLPLIRLAAQQWLLSCRYFVMTFRCYRSYPTFVFPWLWLKLCYLFDSPYAVSRRFLKRQKAVDCYSYGETPILTLAEIMSCVEVKQSDHLFELGAGSGFTSLWLSGVKGCRVTAVERIPTFCWRLQRTLKRFKLSDRIQMLCQDYLSVDLSEATVIYLYASNLDEVTIQQLGEKVAELKAGTLIISVSFPLPNKTRLRLINTCSVRFDWGVAKVFVQKVL